MYLYLWHVHACTSPHLLVYVHAYIPTCSRTYTPTCMNACMHACMYIPEISQCMYVSIIIYGQAVLILRLLSSTRTQEYIPLSPKP